MSTITDILQLRVQTQPDQVAYSFLQDGEILHSLTYRELDQRSWGVAANLRAMQATGPVLLLYPSGLDFIAAFFGCIYAGVVSVPLFPPRRHRSDPRIVAIIADSKARFGLTTSEILVDLEQRSAQQPEIKQLLWASTDDFATKFDASRYSSAIENESLAYLQYTSGSTSIPKGVMVSHAGLLHTLTDLDGGWKHDSGSVMITWLPLFHDMGLIYGMLQPLYNGFPCYLMEPAAFLQRPVRWLEAISRYGGTHSAAPNFAFELCVRGVSEAEKASLDLRRWQVVLNAAEPVREATLQRFAAAFEPCGFALRVFCPGYGLAESTLKVTAVRRDVEPKTLRVLAEALSRGRVVEAGDGATNVRTLVGCGVSEVGARIVIVDPETLTENAADRVGEIWVSGDSVALGYWQRPRETEEIFGAHLADTGEGPFLRTGDMGFMRDDELFITGRLKDMIIIRGMNHYPQDIELTVERCYPAFRPGGGAAFALEVSGEERLVVAQELERTWLRSVDVNEATEAIRAAVAREHGLTVHAVALLRPASIPKTSSGKIQRRACCRNFLSGQLKVIAQWQEPSASRLGERDAPSGEPGPRSREAIEQWILARLAERLGLSPLQLDARDPFAKLGLDSLSAVRLSCALENWLSRKLSPTVAFEYPTPEAMSHFLADGLPLAEPTVPLHRNGNALREPIAVIGLACRFPGAPNAESFWQGLCAGAESVRAAPTIRWSGRGFHTSPAAGAIRRASTQPGHFLDAIDRFDAEFFGFSPREAQSMDPQQRLLLEVAWEAMENAGQADLAGSFTGVFVGISTSDYSRLLFSQPERTDAYCGTGGALSIAANRLSYLLDLRGPSWAVDTACSSSLVALHNACQALHLGECDLAFAGGVNLIISPELTAALADARMLAGDGRCKTFDANADGYGRGEGCGVVVLKRHSDALRDGDRILALVMGSAVNQDGRSNGLTAPNGLAQQQVIRRALENAGIEPSTISYVETHGTGTPLGDPIEVDALKAVLAEGRAVNQACWLGSVKTNIGHLEAAAGIAGFIKAVLALQHGELPPHLHLRRLNPHIRLDGTPFAIPAARQVWPAAEQPRTAGVSSFGFGGTNAHVILREVEPEQAGVREASPPAAPAHVQILALSAKHPNALRQLAAGYLAFLEAEPETTLADLCFSANTGRQHFRHRCATIASSPQQLRQKLAVLAVGEQPVETCVGEAPLSGRPRVVFMFSGQGCQYPGMGRDLYETEPRFRRILEECDRLLRPWLATPLLEVLYGAPGEGELLEQTAYAQPALFALEYALAALWRSWGIEPAAVMGHSLGEYVAACVAGVFGLEDGLKLVAERGRLMQAAPGQGEMVAVFAPEARVAETVAVFSKDLSIAALNGPHNTVISGTSEAVAAAVAAFAEVKITTQKLRTSHAFHSALMEPVLAEFRRVAASAKYRPPVIDVISNLSGGLTTAEMTTPEYWCRHLRQPVRFAAGMETLAQSDYRLFLEIGPHPVLLVQGRECIADDGNFAWLPSLRRSRSDRQQMLAGLAELYVRGARVDWREFYRGLGHRRLRLPTYPFQRQRFWLSPAKGPEGGAASNDDYAPTTVAKLIEQGDVGALARHVAQAGDLAPEHLNALDACMRALVRQHRKEASASSFPDWFYRVCWECKPRHGEIPSVPHDPGRWLILSDRDGVGEQLLRFLESAGARCVLYSGGDLGRDGARPAESPWRVALDWLCAEASEGGLPSDFRGIVQLEALDAPVLGAVTGESLVEWHNKLCGRTLRLLQDLARRNGTVSPKLWLVTQGAVPADGSGSTADAPFWGGAEPDSSEAFWQAGQASLWGMGRVFRLEQPDLWGGLVDLAPGRDARDQAEALAAELVDAGGEDQIALRPGRRLVPRLRAADSVSSGQGFADSANRARIWADRTYLITGGLGGLGLTVAEWMVEQGARNLVLVGRSAPSVDAARRVADLESAAARVVVARADVSLESDVARLLGESREGMPPLGGIIHAAAVIDDGILLKQDSLRMAAVVAPKAAGAWNLHRLTRNLPLDFFVLFSSATALLGWRGQGTYAAANAFLDALAHYRRGLGLPALSINWGPWAGIGAAAELDGRYGSRWESQGICSLDPDQGVRALELAMAGMEAQIVVLPMDRALLAQGFSPTSPWMLLADLVPEPQPKDVPAPATGYALHHRLREAAASERRSILISHIQAEVAKILGFPPGQGPDVRQGFFDMGLDSLMALELKNRLDAAVGRRLPSTLAFDCPSIESLATHLSELLAPTSPQPAPRKDATEDETLAEIRRLSESELESLVNQELQRSLR